MNRMLRRNIRRAISLAAAATFALAPTIAIAESCSELRSDRSEINGEMLHLVREYPFTHAVIAACAAGNSQSKSLSSFLVCAGIACIAIGTDNCSDVAEQWFKLGSQSSDIDRTMREQGCGS